MKDFEARLDNDDVKSWAWKAAGELMFILRGGCGSFLPPRRGERLPEDDAFRIAAWLRENDFIEHQLLNIAEDMYKLCHRYDERVAAGERLKKEN